MLKKNIQATVLKKRKHFHPYTKNKYNTKKKKEFANVSSNFFQTWNAFACIFFFQSLKANKVCKYF